VNDRANVIEHGAQRPLAQISHTRRHESPPATPTRPRHPDTRTHGGRRIGG
jgi:hypothetical protein